MTISGSTIAELLAKAKEAVLKSGVDKNGQRGQTRSLKCVDLILNEPLADPDPYPFWDQAATQWYLDRFVAKDKGYLPENLAEPGQNLFPYTYAHRSRFYDLGFGYTLGFCLAVNQTGWNLKRLTSRKNFRDFLMDVGQLAHVQNALAVMYWWGREILMVWVKNPKVIGEWLTVSRRDTLLDVIAQVRLAPETRRAITPSFIYPNIDLALPAGGIPPYQNYQLWQSESGLTSIHLHRAVDLRGGAQLDFSHDLSWGKLASAMLKKPLDQVIIRVNDLYLPTAGNPAVAEDIKTWLAAVTDGYLATQEGIAQELAKGEYKETISMVLDRWR